MGLRVSEGLKFSKEKKADTQKDQSYQPISDLVLP